MNKGNWLSEQENNSTTPLSDVDRELYALLFSELEKKGEVSIPNDFAMKVAAKQGKKDSLWFDIKLYAFYAGLFMALIGIVLVFFSFDKSQIGSSFAKSLSSNMIYIALVCFGYFIIQTLDRVLVGNGSLD